MKKEDIEQMNVNFHSNEQEESRPELATSEDLGWEHDKEKEETRMDRQFSPSPLQQEVVNGKDAFDNLVYAGFWMRFWAYIVDMMIIAAITGILITPLFYYFGWSMTEISLFSPYTIVTAAVFYLYFILMTKFFQQTLGKMIFGLKVIPLKEDSLTWGTVIFREWIGRYISVSVKILYFLVIFLPKKQGLHDIFADTAVIHEQVVKKQPATV